MKFGVCHFCLAYIYIFFYYYRAVAEYIFLINAGLLGGQLGSERSAEGKMRGAKPVHGHWE